MSKLYVTKIFFLLSKIYHPNIHEDFGAVCLDVIDYGWKETYNLCQIFDYFLPQLLADPNPEDPMDFETALLLIDSPEAYKEKVKDYVRKYAVEGPTLRPRPTRRPEWHTGVRWE